MQEHEDLEIRSEEVQEVLGTPPSWMVQYGTLLAFLVILVLGYLSYFIEYPVMVEAGISVTSTDPPKRLVTNSSGRVASILVENESEVEADDIIVVLKSNARFEDVLSLESAMLSLGTPSDSALLAFQVPESLMLGGLKETLFDFYRKQKTLQQYESNPYDKLSMDQLSRELSKIRRIIVSDKGRINNLDRQVEMVENRLQREEGLSQENLLAQGRVAKTREDLLALKRMRESIESSIKNRELEMERIRAEMDGVKAGSLEGKKQASVSIRESFAELQRAVEDWFFRYVITAPVDGIVSLYLEKITEQQFVEEGWEIGVVVPNKQEKAKGTIWLPVAIASPVEEGQEVVVRFSSYPSLEFGAVIGRVASKSQVPINNQVSITVSFPKGLVTEFGREIDASQEMKGEARIILQDKRLIERIFEHFRSQS
ncbi:HlyD family efflux transporter periplasmic adaptor subunit [Phaeodactylibacter luteus]|uniref:HlyD family efflux transporter periplasmic adaptor subunit n=1 Tax=Phaeodactylibacter luteus TaxID=1564516 RepID=A0A5C6RMP5_9BACT|nr:HlyD family efflux transporter periplasmic adaptor subunit [Phaeodactylibacter luteus]TXB63576.1 HlyD family efflux transporter periplasmic adaptor subunit [Phaeodactylibacter luteus]